jgi:uncharacterized protein (TIGR02118 family)
MAVDARRSRSISEAEDSKLRRRRGSRYRKSSHRFQRLGVTSVDVEGALDEPVASVSNVAMIKVSVLYANRDGASFDMKYYLDVHVPLVERLLGEALKGAEVDQGIGALQGPPAYVAIGHLWFDSVDAFQAALGAHGAEIMADIPKYTNIQPIIQISSVRIANKPVAWRAGN